MKEKVPDSIAELARQIFEVMRPTLVAAKEKSEPFAFFGHSLGALLAFEVAVLVKQEVGVEPLRMFVSGAASPQFYHRDPITQHPDGKFWECINSMGGTPDIIMQNAELREMVTPTVRADIALAERYQYVEVTPHGKKSECLTCPVSVWSGEDEGIAQEHLEGWGKLTSGESSVTLFSGGHFFLLKDDTLARLVGLMNAALP